MSGNPSILSHPIHPSIPSIIPFVCLSIHPSTIYPSVRPASRPSFHLSFCPSLYPSIFLILFIFPFLSFVFFISVILLISVIVYRDYFFLLFVIHLFPFFPIFSRKVWLAAIALMILGLSYSFYLVPVMPDMMATALYVTLLLYIYDSENPGITTFQKSHEGERSYLLATTA